MAFFGVLADVGLLPSGSVIGPILAQEPPGYHSLSAMGFADTPRLCGPTVVPSLKRRGAGCGAAG